MVCVYQQCNLSNLSNLTGIDEILRTATRLAANKILSILGMHSRNLTIANQNCLKHQPILYKDMNL